MSDNSASEIPTFASVYEIFLSLPLQTQIGIVMFASIWIVGGNILTYYSLRRRGIPWWKAFIPTTKVFAGFSKIEYGILGFLAIASLGSAMWGMNAQV